jgi:hypothetical protein
VNPSFQENFPQTNISGSSAEIQERVLTTLVKKVNELSDELHNIKANTILKESGLPPDVLEQLGVNLEKPPRTRRGGGYRPLLAYEIIDAKETLKKRRPEVNEAMVARFLGVNYFTYKKYAKIYGLWDPKPNVKGKSGICDPERGKHPLSEILEGKYPDYPVFRIKDKLIRGGIKEAKCENCGFKEKRVIDGKVPLILNFMDENPKNHRLENIKLYCYNCTFTSGRGYIRKGNHYFDPDFLQDADKEIAEGPARF